MSNLTSRAIPEHVLPLYISGTAPVTLPQNTYSAVIQTDTSSVVVNLPALSGTIIGDTILFSANAGGGTITITPHGTDTINGSTNPFILTAGAATVVASPDNFTPADWEISSTSVGLGGNNYTLINTENGAVTQTLANGNVGETMVVSLLSKRGFPATVQTSRGSIFLTPNYSARTLYFENNIWNILDINDNNSFFPTTQYGSKLTATGESGAGFFGASVALSADGNTMAIGAISETTTYGGGAYIFTRTSTLNSAWSQQTKLVPSNPVATDINYGYSVALSSDGNTCAVGAPFDNANPGAVWIFTRAGTVWTQQAKLIGTGITGAASFQGSSVALAADGNTCAVGGPGDNTNVGAVWIFNRIAGAWTQQSKLVGTGNTGAAQMGTSVALSATGNTLTLGGPDDNTNVGAIWMFTRVGVTWTQIGTKLTLHTETGAGTFGTSVAISADGFTVAAGAPADNTNVGQVGIFVYDNVPTGIVWTQEGIGLFGTPLETGASHFGNALALSADGRTLAVGGVQDAAGVGSVITYTAIGNVFTPSSLYYQQAKLVGTGATGNAEQGYAVALNSNGNTLAIGGPQDNTSVGATWMFD